jgi:hypothetical protein
LLSASGFEAPPADLFKKPESDYKTDADLQVSNDGALVDPASGTEITKESGKTVFGNWVQVDPGEEATVTLEYLLPFEFSMPQAAEKNWWNNLSEQFSPQKKPGVSYQLLVQKQPGIVSNFESSLVFPGGWKPDWQYGENVSVKAASVETNDQLNTDKVYLFGFSPEN